VAVSVLDRLMNLAGELVLSRNQLLQAVSATTQSGLDATTSRLDQVTSELQEAIMQTRMQPLAQVFNRFPRVVRDLSAKLGKHVDLEIHGKEVEVDKSIIEAISDPLVHLVRNSLDHGIETPDQRTAKGKRGTGTITIEASHQAGRVNITVRDDGAGIDPAKLKSKAVAKGILTPEQAAAMSDREAVELVFHPGFSTAEAVTDVSGRGVGMDVVKSNIARLGGTVEILSHVGRGTEVHVKLPLTLAIIPSLIVRCANQRFAISQASIQELVRVNAAELATRVCAANCYLSFVSRVCLASIRIRAYRPKPVDWKSSLWKGAMFAMVWWLMDSTTRKRSS
jgi:two-component system chemotaxis sensor kinase CheA